MQMIRLMLPFALFLAPEAITVRRDGGPGVICCCKYHPCKDDDATPPFLAPPVFDVTSKAYMKSGCCKYMENQHGTGCETRYTYSNIFKDDVFDRIEDRIVCDAGLIVENSDWDTRDWPIKHTKEEILSHLEKLGWQEPGGPGAKFANKCRSNDQCPPNFVCKKGWQRERRYINGTLKNEKIATHDKEYGVCTVNKAVVEAKVIQKLGHGQKCSETEKELRDAAYRSYNPFAFVLHDVNPCEEGEIVVNRGNYIPDDLRSDYPHNIDRFTRVARYNRAAFLPSLRCSESRRKKNEGEKVCCVPEGTEIVYPRKQTLFHEATDDYGLYERNVRNSASEQRIKFAQEYCCSGTYTVSRSSPAFYHNSAFYDRVYCA